MWVRAPAWFLFCFSGGKNGEKREEKVIPLIFYSWEHLGIKVDSYLWTSRSPLLFVICHVNPLLGSKPGCEISKPYFLTSLIYLEMENDINSVGLNTYAKKNTYV